MPETLEVGRHVVFGRHGLTARNAHVVADRDGIRLSPKPTAPGDCCYWPCPCPDMPPTLGVYENVTHQLVGTLTHTSGRLGVSICGGTATVYTGTVTATGEEDPFAAWLRDNPTYTFTARAGHQGAECAFCFDPYGGFTQVMPVNGLAVSRPAPAGTAVPLTVTCAAGRLAVRYTDAHGAEQAVTVGMCDASCVSSTHPRASYPSLVSEPFQIGQVGTRGGTDACGQPVTGDFPLSDFGFYLSSAGPLPATGYPRRTVVYPPGVPDPLFGGGPDTDLHTPRTLPGVVTAGVTPVWTVRAVLSAFCRDGTRPDCPVPATATVSFDFSTIDLRLGLVGPAAPGQPCGFSYTASKYVTVTTAVGIPPWSCGPISYPAVNYTATNTGYLVAAYGPTGAPQIGMYLLNTGPAHGPGKCPPFSGTTRPEVLAPGQSMCRNSFITVGELPASSTMPLTGCNIVSEYGETGNPAGPYDCLSVGVAGGVVVTP